MSILGIKKNIFIYMLATIFILIFGIIYEAFSHGVYSIFMQYAFLIPLFGLIINLIFKPNKLFDLSIITITIGSIIKGVLDIYGTTNSLLIIYPLIGGLLLIISLLTMKRA